MKPIIFRIRKKNTRWMIYNRYGKQQPPFDGDIWYCYGWALNFEDAIYVVGIGLHVRGYPRALDTDKV